MRRRARTGTAFTLIELLVVIAIIALLIGILLPSLGAARRQGRVTASGSNLRQLGVALELYHNDYDRTMPQQVAPGFDGRLDVIGSLYGGKKGQVPLFGINSIGPSGRPLNAYLDARDLPPDSETPDGSYDTPSRFEFEVFRSPLDAGMGNTTLPPGLGPASTESVYDLLGASYAINDHAPDANPYAEEIPTLIPEGGGRMPIIADTTRTFSFAGFPVYAYDDAADRDCHWYTKKEERTSLVFLDGHVKTDVAVPEGAVSATEDYTFLPRPGWTGFGRN